MQRSASGMYQGPSARGHSALQNRSPGGGAGSPVTHHEPMLSGSGHVDISPACPKLVCCSCGSVAFITEENKSQETGVSSMRPEPSKGQSCGACPALQRAAPAARSTAMPGLACQPAARLSSASSGASCPAQIHSRSGSTSGATSVQAYSAAVHHSHTTLTQTLVHPTLMRYCGSPAAEPHPVISMAT